MPKTCSLLRHQPSVVGRVGSLELDGPGQVTILKLAPGAKLIPHTGPNNMRLTAHLALIVPQPAAYLTCGNPALDGAVREWREGGVIVFDDSYVHEAHNPATEHRYVLYASLWHPDMGIQSLQGVKPAPAPVIYNEETVTPAVTLAVAPAGMPKADAEGIEDHGEGGMEEEAEAAGDGEADVEEVFPEGQEGQEEEEIEEEKEIEEEEELEPERGGNEGGWGPMGAPGKAEKDETGQLGKLSRPGEGYEEL
jgi:hypothetical protein